MKSPSSIVHLSSIALCTAIIVIMAQLSIPMPLGVPMTMQTFAITLAAVILGAKKGGLATLIYILLGAAGLPVFAGFTGGIQSLVGPTGGFILSFPIMAYITGLGIRQKNRPDLYYAFFVVLGFLINYAFGTAFFCLLAKAPVAAGLSACVIPFIPTTVIKAVLATLIGFQIRRRLPAPALRVF